MEKVIYKPRTLIMLLVVLHRVDNEDKTDNSDNSDRHNIIEKIHNLRDVSASVHYTFWAINKVTSLFGIKTGHWLRCRGGGRVNTLNFVLNPPTEI